MFTQKSFNEKWDSKFNFIDIISENLTAFNISSFEKKSWDHTGHIKTTEFKLTKTKIATPQMFLFTQD